MPQTAKLVTTGETQSVHLPADCHLPGSEAAVRQNAATGDITLSPLQPQAEREALWDEFFRLLEELTPEERDSFSFTRDTTPSSSRLLP